MTEYESFYLNDLVAQYLRSRSKCSAMSLSTAVRAITTVMPDCPLGREELEQLIADAALYKGYALLLDGSLETLDLQGRPVVFDSSAGSAASHR
jgi:hypothetical protein